VVDNVNAALVWLRRVRHDLLRRRGDLERKIGQQALELDFLKGCLQRIEEQRMLQALNGKPRSSGKPKKK
jgi:hypothetical protein